MNRESNLPYNSEKSSLNFRTANCETVRTYLKQVVWIKLFEDSDGVNEMLDVFYETINDVIHKFIPSRVPRKYPQWFNYKLIKMLNLKNNIRSRYNKYKNPMDLIELKIISKRCDKAVDSGHQADVIYTDFSKAFDKVSYKILSCKLRAYGISGGLLEWVVSYLNGRSFLLWLTFINLTYIICHLESHKALI